MTDTLFANVRLIDATGAEPYTADVLVTGERIGTVAPGGTLTPDGARVIDIPGATLMPGLVESHAHLSFTDFTDSTQLGELPPEDHALATAYFARVLLDAGFTSCVSGASAKGRLDVAVRNAIERGIMPGPRLLAASPELTVTAGLGDIRLSHLYRENYAVVLDGADAFRQAARTFVREGVDTIKLNLSGDANVPHARAESTPMTEAEATAACEVAREHGVRVAAHARSKRSIEMAVRLGVQVIYHCSFCDEATLDALESRKDELFVAPTLGAIHATLHAAAYGLPRNDEHRARLERELEAACESAIALKSRGVRVLPGGDYGFAWNRQGDNARDLAHFVSLLGFTPLEAIEAATRLGGEMMMRGGELGQIRPGFLADLILVDGDPLADIAVLQGPDRLHAVMKNGEFHRAPPVPG